MRESAIDAAGPPLALRLRADPRVRAAEPDWSRTPAGWCSANGWELRRAAPGELAHVGDGWVVLAPDGCPEWWADDPVTAMQRAERQP